MALTLHGSARSRTLRVLWMAAELGLDYTHDPIAFDDPALKSPAFLRLNPAGAIPTIEDDGFALTGRARETTDPEIDRIVRGQVLAEREGKVWPGFDEEVIFELGIERCLLMLSRRPPEILSWSSW